MEAEAEPAQSPVGEASGAQRYGPVYTCVRQDALSSEGFQSLASPLAPAASRLNRRSLLTAGAAALGLGAAGCRSGGRGGRDLIVWHNWGGVQGPRFLKVAEAYQKSHPNVRLKLVFTQNDMSAMATNQKFFTAVAAGTPPDVTLVDGPQVASWAEWGALEPLNDRITRSGIRAEDYFPPTWRQNLYKDQVWALTYCADPNFAFAWNKDAFRKAGLDPEKPPVTIDDMDRLADRLTHSEGGAIQQIGIIPWAQYGPPNSMFTWGWVFGGSFYDDRTRKITADDPKIVQALEWMTGYAKRYDPARIQAMAAGFGTAEADPFYSGTLAMKCLHIGGIGEIGRYAPGLDFGLTYIPAPPTGEQHSSWVGGWCMAMPRGCRNPDDAWDFIQWMCHSPEGTTAAGREQLLFPGMARSPFFAEDAAKEPHYGRFVEILRESRHQRPVMPVQAFYMRQLHRAVDASIYSRKTPAQALANAREATQSELDLALAGA